MLKLSLRFWLLLSLTLLFFLWFIGQQTPQLSLDNLSPNFTTSTFYQVTVSSYANTETTKEINEGFTFDEFNQKLDQESKRENHLFLPMQQQVDMQKLHLDASPAVAFFDLHWQWQDFLVEAKTGFSKENQVFLEHVALSQQTVTLDTKTLTIDLKNRTAKSNDPLFWHAKMSAGQAAGLFYQAQRLHLYQVETWIYLDERHPQAIPPVIPMPMETK